MTDMECPYCEHAFNYCDDEPMGEGEMDSTECPECEKSFAFHRSYSISYWPQKADCLNGAPHSFSDVTRSPPVIGGKIAVLCKDCGRYEDRPSKCPHGGPFCMECRE